MSKTQLNHEVEPDVMQITKDEALEFAKFKALEESKTELIGWAKKRFWWLSVILAALGLLGFNFVIRTTVQDLLKNDVGEAQKAGIRASLAAEDAQTAAKQAKKELVEIRGQAESMTTDLDRLQGAINERAADVNEQLARLQAGIDGMTTHAAEYTRVATADLEQRFQLLVAALKRAGVPVPDAPVGAEAGVGPTEPRPEAVATGTDLKRQFEENSAFSVDVNFNADRRELAEAIGTKLQSLGYRVSVVLTPGSYSTTDPGPDGISLSYSDGTEDRANKIAETIRGTSGTTVVTLKRRPGPSGATVASFRILLNSMPWNPEKARQRAQTSRAQQPSIRKD